MKKKSERVQRISKPTKMLWSEMTPEEVIESMRQALKDTVNEGRPLNKLLVTPEQLKWFKSKGYSEDQFEVYQ